MGNLVKFVRGSYSHWAAFVGDGMFIHLAGDKNVNTTKDMLTISGKKYSKAIVRQDRYGDVTGESKAYKKNENDKDFRPSTVNELAIENISLLLDSCEDFASLCRNGQRIIRTNSVFHRNIAVLAVPQPGDLVEFGCEDFALYRSYGQWIIRNNPVNDHNTAVLAALQPGDLVEFERVYYSHWAVFVGDGMVIHLSGDEKDGLNANINIESVFTICGKKYSKASVRKDMFYDVTCNSKAYINISKDNRYQPTEADKIVERALEKVGEIGYNILWYNCEHFASYCRYGESISDQVSIRFNTVVLPFFTMFPYGNVFYYDVFKVNFDLGLVVGYELYLRLLRSRLRSQLRYRNTLSTQ